MALLQSQVKKLSDIRMSNGQIIKKSERFRSGDKVIVLPDALNKLIAENSSNIKYYQGHVLIIANPSYNSGYVRVSHPIKDADKVFMFHEDSLDFAPPQGIQDILSIHYKKMEPEEKRIFLKSVIELLESEHDFGYRLRNLINEYTVKTK